MLLDLKELSKLSDDDFDRIVTPFDKKVEKHIHENVINQYSAFYIATGFRMSAIWNNNFKTLVENATLELSQYTSDNCDMDRIKSILKNKYGLLVIADDPIEIIEVKNKRNEV